ncbi:MAG: hypothetical protein LBP39_03050, partial [Rickettsiales bacterium]|nr:hypothetical protein [Rickettsiales bacterium]
MKTSKKVGYSKIAALSSYLFLGILTIFIGPGAGLCLAKAVDVHNPGNLERALGDNSSTVINIKASYITLGQNLPVVNRSLAISGETNGSTLDGNEKYRILEFNPNLADITINNIRFQNGRNEDPADNNNGGGAAHIGERTTIAFNSTDFSNNTAVSHGGAIYYRGNVNNNILRFNGKTTFAGNESTNGSGGAILAVFSDLIFAGEAKFVNNRSLVVGGAIELYSPDDDGAGSRVIFEKAASFSGNSSKNAGGAISSEGNVNSRNSLIFNSGAIFIGNESTNGFGGAILGVFSDLIFAGEAKFVNNRSFYDGGAISLHSVDCGGNGSRVIFEKAASFSGNSSKDVGGAISSEGNAQ